MEYNITFTRQAKRELQKSIRETESNINGLSARSVDWPKTHIHQDPSLCPAGVAED